MKAKVPTMFRIGLTEHLEGPADRPSAEIFDEVAELVCLADQLGADYAWFTEHHGHVHHGHLPTPLLFALHMAGRTKRIRPGTAVVCVNLHHPLDVAEQVAVADVLMQGRSAFGFGSGSTPEELRFFGLSECDEEERHARFQDALGIIQAGWIGAITGMESARYRVGAQNPLPVARAGLVKRCWVAVNSVGAAQIAGSLNFSMLFSHLRTPAQYRAYREAYRLAGGTRLVAANRPVFVGATDVEAFEIVEPALRILWRRFQKEGKISAEVEEPKSPADLCGHPINFIVGGPESVAVQLKTLYTEVPFDVANVEVRWAGLGHDVVMESLRRLLEDVVPLLRD